MAKLIISRDGNVIESRFIEQGRLSIGSASDNDLMLSGVGVSRRHARIESVANDDILHDLDSANGTRVNGVAVQQCVLKHDDVIEIAGFDIRYRNHKVLDGRTFDATMIIEPLAGGESPLASGQVVTRSKRRERSRGSDFRVATLQPLDGLGVPPIALNQLLRTVGDAANGMAVINARPHGYFITHVIGDRPARLNGTPIGATAQALTNGDVIELAGERFRFLRS